MTKPSPGARLAAYVTLVLIGGFAFVPVYWMVRTAISPADQVFAFPPQFVPTEITGQHFAGLVSNPELVKFFTNSVIVSTLTALLTLLVSTYTAYSFSKFRYRGRAALMYLVIASQMFPHGLLLITLYMLYSAFGLLDSYLGLILSFTAFTLPLCIWMLKGIFDTIPNEVIEAAKIDGAGQSVIIHQIVTPIAAPGLAVVGLFGFIRGWNDFIFALTIAGPKTMTLPPGLVSRYTGEFGSQWPELMAASLAVSIPVVLVFIGLQKFLISGLAGGAIKG